MAARTQEFKAWASEGLTFHQAKQGALGVREEGKESVREYKLSTEGKGENKNSDGVRKAKL